MDVLIKFSERGGFKDKCDVKKYFACTVPEQSSFCNLGSKISEDNIETMYFTYEGVLIAKAKYVSYDIDNKDFQHAYKIKDIIVFANLEKINSDLFQGQVINYIKSDKQKIYIKTLNEKLLG